MNYKNNSPEDNIERRLREIETELDRQNPTIPVTAESSGKKSPGRLEKMGRMGKAIAFSAVALAGVWVLTTVVSFVSMMLGFVIVGGVIYAAWKIIYSR
ncbi:hypothetical protein ACE1CI_22805 [Aerosakkonemataceae cyanobacterium BLCC-F50]|uniref:Uncharacterized protein n=1 Tax=Floridaenema flaviceps BLCC-F50 TaxID=3153642 RepID=A0ABV4XVQ5_9CYAN